MKQSPGRGLLVVLAVSSLTCSPRARTDQGTSIGAGDHEFSIGHGWPGESPPPGGENLAGPQTRLVRAADELWAFVSRFRTP